jgi:flagellar motor switch protein FliM
MPQEKMSQDEIDALINNTFNNDFDDIADKLFDSPLDPDEVKYKYNATVACKAAYEYALENGTFEDIKEAKKNLHRAGFSNWLFKNGLDRDGYYKLINREAVKRGLRPPFSSFNK